MGQQPCGWNALVDHLRRHRRLHQRFALATGPFPTHMLLDGEHARRVTQLFDDVFADALKLAAAGALGVFRFVMESVAVPSIEVHLSRACLNLMPNLDKWLGETCL
ncbi:hypothetical protein D9M68_974250 [compost metagenome]